MDVVGCNMGPVLPMPFKLWSLLPVLLSTGAGESPSQSMFKVPLVPTSSLATLGQALGWGANGRKHGSLMAGAGGLFVVQGPRPGPASVPWHSLPLYLFPQVLWRQEPKACGDHTPERNPHLVAELLSLLGHLHQY